MQRRRCLVLSRLASGSISQWGTYSVDIEGRRRGVDEVINKTISSCYPCSYLTQILRILDIIRYCYLLFPSSLLDRLSIMSPGVTLASINQIIQHQDRVCAARLCKLLCQLRGRCLTIGEQLCQYPIGWQLLGDHPHGERQT